MSYYHQQGLVPHKRHTQFRKPDGGLYSEELFSTEGFSADYSLLYHLHPPTRITGTGFPKPYGPEPLTDPQPLRHRSLEGFQIIPNTDYLLSRTTLLFNNDCHISVAAPLRGFTDYFFKNASADEIIFIHEGSGSLHTMCGNIDFAYGDYLVIPRGCIYQLSFTNDNNRLLIIESFSAVHLPRTYVSKGGQLLEHAPFCERDLRAPVLQTPIDQIGEHCIMIKKQGQLHPVYYANHPFDVVGWDGCCYPYAFSIHDFEPITGRIHQPPPVHQNFEAHNFVVCSFVPRLYDYHPDAIPAPYNHSNIDSDEVLYYVDGDFMSRKSVSRGMLTLHPAGIPHGPHPGSVEKSIGRKETKELAVMIDTFHPLLLTKAAITIENQGYNESWNTHE